MSSAYDTVLATASYRGDIDHFQLLRRSLKRFGLGDIPHHVVVHTEDRELFLPLVDGGMQLHTTADVLPPQIEANRLRAAAVRRRLGRRAAIWLMSLEKRVSVLPFMRCEGWQVQQLTKLALSRYLDCKRYVIFDSDVVVCATPDLKLFGSGDRSVVFEEWLQPAQATSQQQIWHATAESCFEGGPLPGTEGKVNGYVGTPYVFDRATVRAMLERFEHEAGGDWTQRLLRQRPASWSEFATYASYARRHGDRTRLSFAENPHTRRIGNVEQRLKAETLIQDAFADRNIWFLTIESDRRLAARWSIQQHLNRLEGLLA